MTLNMNILRALEGVRTPFFDTLFAALTHLGDQTVFIVLVLALLWCVDKRKGYCLFFIGMVGTAANQLLKAFFLIPRPWLLDPSFTIVESAREAATGYSFPSGHTQSATSIFAALAVWYKKRRWVLAACVAAIVLVAFSRMYLGVHTPLDVGVSLITGFVSAWFGLWAFHKWKSGALQSVALGSTALLIFYLLLWPKGAANVAEFDSHGLESAYTLLGAAIGLTISWLVDEKLLRYEIMAVWWAQLLKLALGFGLLLAIKSLLKSPLNALFGGNPAANCLRYCLVSLFGGLGWPLTFPFWGTLGHNKLRPEDSKHA
ncbi:MAG: phosphatase PAP2 family protein [Candidatus Pelethousia sp.]|nr:phosphatase PAP2 family protein [Candidatus Pelethousia sp.]